MRKRALFASFGMTAWVANVASAQPMPSNQTPRTPPPEIRQDRPRTGPSIGLGGLSLSIQLRAKKKSETPPLEAPLEMRDQLIPDYVPDQVIFILQGQATNAPAIARAARVTIIETAFLSEAGITMVVGQLGVGDTPLAGQSRLARLPGVIWAQPNFQFQLLGRSLPRRFALHAIPERQPRVTGKIVMIDAPVDLAHDNLVGTNITQATFGVADTPALHGTAVAALLVGTGSYPGTAQGAQLTSLAAFGTPESGAYLSRSAYLARAMNEASKLRPDVLNLSFGGPQDRLLGAMLDTIHKNGVCVSAAAGNGGPTGRVLFPANHPNSLAVTAVDENMSAYPFASQGSRLDISGVGVDLSAAVPGGRRSVSGTSFATAVISGALLRMPACNGARNPDLMKQQVASYAQDIGAPGPDAIFGAGLFRLTPPRSRR
jgi:hypothetical protein